MPIRTILTCLLLATTLATVSAVSALPDACESEGVGVGDDAASMDASRTRCDEHHDGGYGDWWYEAWVESDTTEVSVTTAATGTETVFVRSWSERIDYGTAEGAGSQYGRFVEAGHSSSLGGAWRYQTVRAGQDGWRWEGDDGTTDSDAVGVEADVFDSDAPSLGKPTAFWHEAWLKVQRFESDRSGEPRTDCLLFLGSTALPPDVAYLLSALYESAGGLPAETCAVLA